jgi:hypothetical protein
MMIALRSSYSIVTHPCVHLTPSKSFKVHDVITTQYGDVRSERFRSISSYSVALQAYNTDDDDIVHDICCDLNHDLCHRFINNMKRHGFCVLTDVVPPLILEKSVKMINQLSRTLIAHYDYQDDSFIGIDTDRWSITRMPRIGQGKHNIHLDPYLSNHHLVLSQLATQSQFVELLSKYMNRACCLRECGLSLTRPCIKDSTYPWIGDHDGSNDSSSDDGSGEGMEWHSDGSNGEATVLMSFDDIDYEQGALRVIPNSHKIYVDDVGHDEVQSVYM